MPQGLEVFYDGSCDLCSNAMRRYALDDPTGVLTFTDITDDAFCPDPYQRSRAAFYESLHVRTAEGNFLTGIDAVSAIWRALPSRGLRRFAAGAISIPGIHRAAQIVYSVVAKHRGFLSGRRTM